MSLASTWFDLVIGVDVHFEVVPMAPAPMPFPHPFVGLVSDPNGMLFEPIVGAIVDLANARPISPPKGVVFINGVPATKTGTGVSNKTMLPHVPLPPGVAWAPVPRAPMPKVGLHGKVPPPPLPTAPPGDALLLVGSTTVTISGSNAVRMGEIALSCSDPVRLPTASVLAIPKGLPVLIGGPPGINWSSAEGVMVQASGEALLGRMAKRLKVASRLRTLVSRWAPTRLRNMFHKGACF
ncbi:MAG: hypothetical protein ABUS79_28720, partial [Pseudomonadota bacterium]